MFTFKLMRFFKKCLRGHRKKLSRMGRPIRIDQVTFAGLGFGWSALADTPFSQRDDESHAIIERIKLYRERHGIDGDLDSAQMLDRTRWGYQRWLEAENDRRTKAETGDGWVSLGPSNGAGRMTAIAPHLSYFMPTMPSLSLRESRSTQKPWFWEVISTLPVSSRRTG